MLVAATIRSNPPSDIALDYGRLYAQGLDYVRQFCRRNWTDHNTHDPGITILELVCYALTDLAYRAQFPLEDLLTSAPGAGPSVAAGFVTSRQVLPNRALTVLDYRKALIDLAGVRNAWIVPATVRYFADAGESRLRLDDTGGPGIRLVDLCGAYRAVVEYSDDVTTDEARGEVRSQALALLNDNRNLCEDFVDVTAVEPQWYSLCADIELEPNADPSLVEAQIHFHVEQYLALPIRKYSFAEILAKKHTDGNDFTVPEIFEGPLLANGFIDDEELEASSMRTEILLSDVIRLIMQIDGVRAVRDALMNLLIPDGAASPPADKWRLQVPEGRQPRLKTGAGRIVFTKRNLPVVPDARVVENHLAELDQQLRVSLNRSSLDDLPVPTGRFRNTRSYYSFQNHFPAVYGLGPEGLSSTASPQQRAAALQLKAYLLFFDQVLANSLAQMANVGELFSLDAATKSTAFAQVVKSFRDFERIYVAGVDDRALQALLEDDGAAVERRGRFLDHLLARFGENFHEYVSIMRTAFGASIESTIADKCDFLAYIPKQGGERGLARNDAPAAEKLWDSFNISGLERRVMRLLGIRRLHTSIEKSDNGGFRFGINPASDEQILEASVVSFAAPDAAFAAMEQAVIQALRPEAYHQLVTDAGKFQFAIVDGDNPLIVSRDFDSAESRDAAIKTLIAEVRSDSSGETMYLIENIRLRPRTAGDSFLPICINPDCLDCADVDPYSYRLAIVLPDFAGRFQNPDFRSFVEETIRQEAPAHLLPRICWADAELMPPFVQAWRNWITLPADAPDAARQERLNALVGLLPHLRNTYTKQRLHECGEGDDKPPFILDRSVLGTKD